MEKKRAKPAKKRLALLLLTLLALIATVFGGYGSAVALNSTIYSAGNFVQRYLNTLQERDLQTLLAMPGVMPTNLTTGGASQSLALPSIFPENQTSTVSLALLQAETVSEFPTNANVFRDIANADGSHTVTARYYLGERLQESIFSVEPREPRYGVINQWSFKTTPLSMLTITANHHPLFNVGKQTLDTRYGTSAPKNSEFNQSRQYLAIAPANYSFDYESQLLKSEEQSIQTSANTDGFVVLNALATEAFIERVQQKLNEYLDHCTEQHVLLPAGCPLGATIDDRVATPPDWSITAYPKVQLVPGDSSFEMPTTEGTANLHVKVKSLFDGSIENKDISQTFTMSLHANVHDDGSVSIELSY